MYEGVFINVTHNKRQMPDSLVLTIQKLTSGRFPFKKLKKL